MSGLYTSHHKSNRQHLKSKVSPNVEKDTKPFLDNRRAPAQRVKLQPSSAIQRHQQNISHAVIQRVDLSKDKLNIVGEDHNESGGERRGIEKGFCTEFTAGPYWMENEFNVDVDDRNVSADPTVYRLLTTLHSIHRLSSRFDSNYDKFSYATFLPLVVRYCLLLNPLIGLAEQYWQQSEGVAYPGPLTPEQLETRDARLNIRFAALQRFKHSLNLLKRMANKKLTEKERNVVAEHFVIAAHARQQMTQNLMASNPLDKLRSKSMHEAGQQQAGTKGVWKIGESHVDDIKHNLPDIAAPQYHLMTQQQFNAFLIKNKTRVIEIEENPTPAEAQERGLYGKRR